MNKYKRVCVHTYNIYIYIYLYAYNQIQIYMTTVNHEHTCAIPKETGLDAEQPNKLFNLRTSLASRRVFFPLRKRIGPAISGERKLRWDGNEDQGLR
jgi:hypothetical protein